jgi:hypothetical protein
VKTSQRFNWAFQCLNPASTFPAISFSLIKNSTLMAVLLEPVTLRGPWMTVGQGERRLF